MDRSSSTEARDNSHLAVLDRTGCMSDASDDRSIGAKRALSRNRDIHMAKIGRAAFCVLVMILVWATTSCRGTQDQGPDPASANMAPADQGAEPVQTEPPAGAPEEQEYQEPQNGDGGEEQVAEAPEPPPPLPDYSQPSCPGEDYLWTPGYWAYAPAGYFWVPGAWVMAPWMGALWTPPWWGFSGGHYWWHRGYWGPYVGFYGGINYGFGYTGRGFYGGYWGNGVFQYNRSVTNVSLEVVHNVYERNVVNYTSFNRISYNGGQGGVNARPIASENAAFREQRMGPSPAQAQLARQAAGNRGQFASENRGRPATAAARPVAGQGVRPAPQAPVRASEPTNARPYAPAPAAQPNQRPQPTSPGYRPEPDERSRVQPEAQPGAHSAGPAPAARPEARPNPAPHTEAARPTPEARPMAEKPARPAPKARPAAPRERPTEKRMP